MDAYAALNAAISVSQFSPEYDAAVEACVVRGVDPLAYVEVTPFPVSNWQAVIAERLIALALDDLLRTRFQQ